MTYGLSVSNPAGKLVISSEGIGYKYLGTPTLSSSAYRNSTFGSYSSYVYTMTIPAGVSYPIVGVRLLNSSIVNVSPIITQAQPTSLSYVFGIAGVRRAVDTNTGYVYLDSYSPTGPRAAGQNYGLLSIRNMGVYEGDKLQLRLFYTTIGGLSGYRFGYLDGTDSSGASVTMAPLTNYSTNATIVVDSVLKSPDPKVYSNITFTPPTLYMFCPYTDSDGSSGYGLNLYSSANRLTFSSNQPQMVVATLATSGTLTATKDAGAYDWSDYGASLYNNGQDFYSLQYNPSTNNYSTGPVTASASVPIALFGNAGGGQVICTRDSTSEQIFLMNFGLSLDFSGQCIRIPYITSQSASTYNSSTDSLSLYTGAPVRIIIVDGSNL